MAGMAPRAANAHARVNPSPVPGAVGSMTAEQFDRELRKGMEDLAAGRVVSADVVEAEMRGAYGLGV